jgi:hypothetical protein
MKQMYCILIGMIETFVIYFASLAVFLNVDVKQDEIETFDYTTSFDYSCCTYIKDVMHNALPGTGPGVFQKDGQPGKLLPILFYLAKAT